MRHLVRGRKLKRTSSHKKALLKNMATSLFEHKKISTTEAKAKEIRPYVEKLITKAKQAYLKEKAGLLPDGQTIDVHSRRIVGKHIQNKAVLQELFDTIAPAIEERNGGYTRIIKTGFRHGDAARTAIIELVDWSAPKDGAYSMKSRKKAAKSKAKAKEASKDAAEAPTAKPIAKKDETVAVEQSDLVTAPVTAAVEEVNIPQTEISTTGVDTKEVSAVAEDIPEVHVETEIAEKVEDIKSTESVTPTETASVSEETKEANQDEATEPPPVDTPAEEVTKTEETKIESISEDDVKSADENAEETEDKDKPKDKETE